MAAPEGATAWVLMGSLVVSGCASAADGDGELTVGVHAFYGVAGQGTC